MKKKTIGLITSIIVIVGVILFSFVGIEWLFSEQYNEQGISHFLVITIDKNQLKEYVGNLEGRGVFIESLNLDETNFRTIDAENMPIKEALEKKLVSIEEWRKYARNIKKEGETEIIQFENYEIAVTSDECVIRPLSW